MVSSVRRSSIPARQTRVQESPRSDITARQFGVWLENRLEQNLVIDNRPGAGGTLGAAIAS
jgi:hypothetical protein